MKKYEVVNNVCEKLKETNPEEFVLLTLSKENKNDCISFCTIKNNLAFLFAMMSDVCDKWGEVVVTETIVQFINSRPNLSDSFKKSLLEEAVK